jgi:hypothetical protein
VEGLRTEQRGLDLSGEAWTSAEGSKLSGEGRAGQRARTWAEGSELSGGLGAERRARTWAEGSDLGKGLEARQRRCP